MCKRGILALMLICVMLINPFAAFAAGRGGTPTELYYQGGIIDRGTAGGAALYSLTPQIQTAYMLTTDPYIVIGEPTEWEISATGGTAPYEYLVYLAYQDDLSLDPFEDAWTIAETLTPDSAAFRYTFSNEGRYFWQVQVTDASGAYIVFQTRIYETYTQADEADATTVAGKVNSIIASEIESGMSDYSIALALHDWLIYNANYDYTYANSDAAGVLLEGSGICDSYARAYLMLMTAAGVECIIVTGYAGTGDDVSAWDSHGWNMVKLGGSWYHVDCTWDDPNGGGYERHTYFCVDDGTMAKDHLWNTADNTSVDYGMLAPEAEGGEYEAGAEGDYDFTFADAAEYEEKFDAEIAAGNYRTKTKGLYVGDGSFADDIKDEFVQMCQEKAQELANQGLISGCSLGWTGNIVYVRFDWVDVAVDYIRIDEEKLILTQGETATVVPGEYEPAADAFTWTSSDPATAQVTSAYTEEGGLTAQITAVAEGATTITVVSADGLSDSLEVIVAGSYEPDLCLAATETDGAIALAWESIPGVTEYRIMLSTDGAEECLGVTDLYACSISGGVMPVNALNEVYIKAVRVAGGAEAAVYESERLRYLDLAFDSALPEGVVSVESEAFAGAGAICSLYIPDGAENIGPSAFADCSGLVALRIPGSVSAIGDGAFTGTGLRFVQTAEGSFADTWFGENMPEIMIIYE